MKVYVCVYSRGIYVKVKYVSIISFCCSSDPVDNYIYSGCGGKTQAHTASKETSVLFCQVRVCLSESVSRTASTPFLLHVLFKPEPSRGYRTFGLMSVLKK